MENDLEKSKSILKLYIFFGWKCLIEKIIFPQSIFNKLWKQVLTFNSVGLRGLLKFKSSEDTLATFQQTSLFVAISSYMYHCTGHYLVHVQWYKNVVNFALFELFFGQNSTMVRNWRQIPIQKIIRDMKRHEPELIELVLAPKNEK